MDSEDEETWRSKKAMRIARWRTGSGFLAGSVGLLANLVWGARES